MMLSISIHSVWNGRPLGVGTDGGYYFMRFSFLQATTIRAARLPYKFLPVIPWRDWTWLISFLTSSGQTAAHSVRLNV